MPQLKYLISASLMLGKTTTQSRTTSGSDVIATVGQPLEATLATRYTRRWDTAATQHNDDGDEPVEFVYEISEPSNRWLISGLKRGHFAARAEEDVRIDLVLVPLVTGRILLPRVEVRLAKPRTSDGPLDHSSDQSRPVVVSTCETEYLSQAVTVIVVAGEESTKVRIGGRAGSAGELGLVRLPA